MTDQLAELAAAATPRPWRWPVGGSIVSDDGIVMVGEIANADAALIVYAVNNIEAVTRDRDRLRGALLAVARIQLGFACWCPPSWGDGHTDACRGARAALGGEE